MAGKMPALLVLIFETGFLTKGSASLQRFSEMSLTLFFEMDRGPLADNLTCSYFIDGEGL